MAVKAAGVNPVETYIRSGAYPRLPALPYTPGADAAGIVHAVGPGVTRWKEREKPLHQPPPPLNEIASFKTFGFLFYLSQ